MPVLELLRMVQAKEEALINAKRLYQDRLAPDFNPFDFIKPDEMRLSSILAWLLDPHASHGQGGRFLGLFLARVPKAWPAEFCEDATAWTEFVAHEGRMDITVSSRNHRLVIENKPWAAAQPAQLGRYFTHLDREAGRDAEFFLIYLTSDGSSPPLGSLSEEQRCARVKARQLYCWSYREHLLEWLAECRAVCRADRVAIFIDEFSRYILNRFVGIPDMTMQDQLVRDVTQSVENVRAAMLVVQAAPVIKAKLLSKLCDKISIMTAGDGWTHAGNLSDRRWSYINIELFSNSKCLFSFGFEDPNYNNFGYGITKKNKSHSDDGGAHAALTRHIGIGNSDPTGGWPWWKKASLSDRYFSFEPDWRNTATPWIEIASGKMAETIVSTARRFRDVMMRGEVVRSSAGLLDWSDGVKAQTRDLINGRGSTGTPEGSLHLKHITSGFGIITEDDLVNGVFRIVDQKTKAETTFASIDELIAAGWVID